jgi:beta-lactamase superfamily II metal-dependent hydrolase
MIDILSLEVFNARHGDAMLLHVGKKSALAHIMFDGGPSGVYKKTVRPRLADIKKTNKSGKIDHVFLTHLDDDHARGIIDYLKEVETQTAPMDCPSCWLNVFNDISKELPAELASVQPATLQPKADSIAVLASIAQGVDLANIARRIPLRVNGGTGKALIADKAGLKLKVLPGIDVTLIAPNRKRVTALYQEWKKQVKKKKSEEAAVTADYVDKSVFNLSSLVMVVEGTGTDVRMLLTGDSRGDDVIEGLTSAGYMKNKHAHFNLLKVAHHGSDRNYEADFFATVSADYYVISADGNYENPSIETLEWIAKSRQEDDEYEVWLTNESSPFDALQKNIKAACKAVPALKKHLRFRPGNAGSFVIDLLKPLPV